MLEITSLVSSIIFGILFLGTLSDKEYDVALVSFVMTIISLAYFLSKVA